MENAVRYGNSCYLRFFLVENSQRFSLSTDETATPDDFPAHLANLGLSKTAMEKQKFRIAKPGLEGSNFDCLRTRSESVPCKENPLAIDMRGLCPLLQVFDMPTSLRFYRNLLGFEVVANSPPRSADDFDWALLKRNEAELMLNTAYEFDSRPEAPDPALMAGHDDTGLFIGCPDVDDAYRYLLAKGLHLKEPKVTHYGMKQLYLKDPDGFGLCFQSKA